MLYHGNEMGDEITGAMEVLLDVEGLYRMTPFLIDIFLSSVL